MKKRILMMLLAFVMVAGLMPVISTPASASASMAGGGTCYFNGDSVDFGAIKANDILQVGVIVTGTEDKIIAAEGAQTANLWVSEYEIDEKINDVLTTTGFWRVSSVNNNDAIYLSPNATLQFTVTFNTNGGTAVDAITQDYNSTVTIPAGPTKTGFVFTGWATNSDGTGTTYAAGDTITLTSGMTLYAQWKHQHPICGLSCTHSGDHTDVEWTPWNGTDTIEYDANDKAYVYLSADATRGSSLEIPSGNTLYLCLNGNTLETTNIGAVKVSGTLNLCDCSGKETAKITASVDYYYGAGVYIYGTGVFNMYSGSVADCSVSGYRQYGGGVYVAGKFNMYGGAIRNCDISANTNEGGGVYVTGNGVFTMDGGVIDRCKAKKGGGVAVANGGTFIMNNGTITGCNTANEGGGVYITTNGKFTMSGTAAITDCSANMGGGLYIDEGSVNLAGGSITNSYTSSYTTYGSIWLNGDKADMTISGPVTIKGKYNVDLNIYKSSKAKGVIHFTEAGSLVLESGEKLRIRVEYMSKWSTKEATRFLTASSADQRNALKDQITLKVRDNTPKIYDYDIDSVHGLRFAERNYIYYLDSAGTLTLSDDAGYCFETVTVTVTPPADYRLVSLTAQTSGQTEITLVPTPGFENVYTFEMPADSVEIRATFGRKQVEVNAAEVQPALASLNSTAPIRSISFGTSCPDGYGSDSVDYATTETTANGDIYIASKVTDGATDVVIYSDDAVLLTGDISGLFAGMNKLTTVDFDNIEMSNLTDTDMFAGCTDLLQIKTAATMTNVNVPLPYNFGASAGATSITNLIDASASQTLGRQYTITYSPAYGTDGKPVSYYYGYGVTLPDTLSRTGYTFDGLFGDAEMTQAVSSVSTTDAGDKTIYVKWTPIEYTISYTLDGGELPAEAPNAYTIEYDAITLINPTRTGYTFTGWTGTELDEQTMNVTIPADSTGNRAYIANWQANSYTVAFDANGGEGEMNVQSFTYDDAAEALTAKNFTREGFTFVGWATSENGSVAYMDEEYVKNMTPTSNGTVTLYAVWGREPVFKIDGTVKDHNDDHVSQAKVELKLGTEVVVTKYTNPSGVFTFPDVKPAEYNIVVTHGPHIVTTLVALSKDANISIKLPEKITNSIVVVENSSNEMTSGILVGGLDGEAKAVRDNGNTNVDKVEVTLTVKDQAPVTGESPELVDIKTQQDAIKEQAPSSGTIVFFDFSVTKTIGSNAEEPMTETATLLEIRIPFEKGNKRDIAVYRYHDNTIDSILNGSAEKMSEVSEGSTDEGFRLGNDGYIYIYTRKFSTYAVGYTVPAPAPSGSYTPTYAIAVEEAGNGIVQANCTYASSGSTVTVAVTPDKGYVLDKLTVTDISGKEVDVAEKDGKYTFKMPAAKVTVKATFKEEVAFKNPFEDVFATDYYYDAVLWAVKEGITNGTSATTFSPNAPCTRAQMVTFLWRAAGYPEPTATACPFTDVDTDSYYGKAVLWAVENGITKGTSDTTFSPDMECSRAQMATFLCRMAGGKAESDVNTFADVKSGAYYAEAVQWAVENGITEGTGEGKFSPDAPCTRGQMVTFLYRYYVK